MLLHWLPAAMLVVAALGRWPYSYYMLLRVIVCITAAWLAIETYQRTRMATAWCVLFLVVAVIFNPLLRFHLTREIWSVFNIVAAALFAAHYFRGPRERSYADS